MPLPWVETETRGVDLHDRRLNERLREVLSQLGAHPTAGIPAACGGHAEMTAAYRLFDNQKVSFDNVLRPHQEATRTRIASQPVAILAQDTTECDLTRPGSQVAGAGLLDKDTRWGAFVHLLHAFTPDGTPLGTVGGWVWSREEVSGAKVLKTRAQRASTPITEKESYRWVVALREAMEVARACPATHLVTVADSESDIYEVFAEGRECPANMDWIVRACQDRVLEPVGVEGESPHPLRERMAQAPERFRISVKVSARQALIPNDTRRRRRSRQAREAVCSVRAATVTLRPPWRPGSRPMAVELNVVLVCEIDAPAEEEPVEWILITSLPIDTDQQVGCVLDYYRTRWMIEIFFRVLKSGCRIEERRFERLDRWEVCLALYLIVAWRTLYVTRLSRRSPELRCDEVFTEAEWKSVWALTFKEKPPSEPPTLEVMVRLVAQLGGYVNRKRPDPPGPQTIWLGLQRTYDIAACWQTFGPGTSTRCQDV